MKAGVTERVAEREAEAQALEAEMAQVCGVLNAATGRLVGLIARVLQSESWEGVGIRSPAQWVAWRCGVSGPRARQLVAMARRLDELPQTRSALEAGELGEDQAAVICRRAPAHADAPIAAFARYATVSQLRRVLVDYTWEPKPEPEADPDAAESRRVSFGHRDSGSWRMSAELPSDEGALVERGLEAARQSLYDRADGSQARHDVSWADALIEMAARSLGGTARPHHERHTVVVHLRADEGGEPAAHLHLGPALSSGLGRYVICDARVRAVLEGEGRAVSVGRAAQAVPTRTRIVIEERDRGCRVPGCDRTCWLQVHHIRHWADGGPTDTWNLVALCSFHHRLHHLGKLGISGNADDPDGLVFTDARGRRLTGSGRPAPPGQLVIGGAWTPPSGERFDSRWVDFSPQSTNC